jgi:hypothetical protein
LARWSTSTIAATTLSGALWCGEWPTPASVVSVAPGMSRAQPAEWMRA